MELKEQDRKLGGSITNLISAFLSQNRTEKEGNASDDAGSAQVSISPLSLPGGGDPESPFTARPFEVGVGEETRNPPAPQLRQLRGKEEPTQSFWVCGTPEKAVLYSFILSLAL